MTRDYLFLSVLLRLLWTLCTLHTSSAETFTLGYITGSQRKPGRAHMLYDRPGAAISGAISLAVNEINSNKDILPNDLLDFTVAETYGDSATSLKQTAELWRQNVSAIIGPQETCSCEAKLAGSLRIPIISYFCHDAEVSDKSKFPTFARTRPPDSQIARSVAAALKFFKWQSVVILNSAEARFAGVVEQVKQSLQAVGVRISAQRSWSGKYYHRFTPNPFVKLVDETFALTRIYVVIGNPDEYIGLMSYLGDSGLLSAGDYFVVGVHNDIYLLDKPESYIKGPLEPFPSPASITTFQSYIGVIGSPPVPDAWSDFSQKVNEYLEAPPFSFKNPFKALGLNRNKAIRPEAAYLYDAVYLYAKAVQEAQDNGEDPLDGEILIKYMKERTYPSVMGYDMFMNEDADTEGNFSLIALKHDSEDETLFGLYPVGTFDIADNDIGTELRLFEAIDWIDGEPPVASLCDVTGGNCETENVIEMAALKELLSET